VIFILVGVAFFTLIERRVLGYIHFRLGPNKVRFLGILQPIRDAIKLFRKESMKFEKLNYFFYCFSPLLGLFLIVLILSIFPFWGLFSVYMYSIILFFCLRSLIVYSLLFMGWSSFSKYSSLGSYRAVAQSISYEVGIILLLLGFCWYVSSYNFFLWSYWQVKYYFIVVLYPMFFCWLMICLAESNRSPFDFSEGESELVSGFNTEYGRGFFSLIFIREYSSILFLCMFTSFFFMKMSIFFMFMVLLYVFFFIWVRGSFPRLRYDKLIIACWKGLLPLILGNMLYFFTYRIFF